MKKKKKEIYSFKVSSHTGKRFFSLKILIIQCVSLRNDIGALHSQTTGNQFLITFVNNLEI